ncbi:hypothetical protein D3C85_1762150 [compost metagenome]
MLSFFDVVTVWLEPGKGDAGVPPKAMEKANSVIAWKSANRKFTSSARRISSCR